ncbi:MAG: HAD-IIB family hydrolase [Elusimicrobium sp.]|jgi:phosphomannomutase|nr:HAD-IIB family hydrolase [Elusimicrobium sp.]
MKKINKKHIYVFDMDGTLTPARLPMTQEFAEWFRVFAAENSVYIVSGSDAAKIKSQLPEDIFNGVDGIYASMGNEFYKQNEKIYRKDFEPDPRLLVMLEEYRKNSRYPGRFFSNYIERRCGMVNFSVIGRDCPYEEREKYKFWDDKYGERINMQKELIKYFPDLDISLGGNISLDIVPVGYGKEQVAEHLRTMHRRAKIIFTGDRTEKGGNDYTLARRLRRMGNSKIIKVLDPRDLMKKFLK